MDGEGKTKEEVLDMLKKSHARAMKLQKENTDYAVIVTSTAIKYIFQADGQEDDKQSFNDTGSSAVEMLYELSYEAKSVIVARATPMQKAQVVDMIKSRNDWNVTLAVGDGANDVAMIQAAHVGIGIKGLEGGQAAAQSDYAIGQFRFLHRLLFVHGRWNYRRLALFYCYFFYKNAVISFSLFFFNFLNGFSAQPLYDVWVLAGFNVAWAAMPIITVAILDRDIVNTDNFHDVPLLYKHGRMNHDYTTPRMLEWYANAIFHAILCCYIPVLAMLDGNILNSDGKDYGLFHTGVLVYTNVVVVITLKLALRVSSWTWIHHLFFWGSFLTWPVFLVLYGSVFYSYGTMNGEFTDTVTWGMFWITCITTTILCLFRDFVWAYMHYRVLPILPPSELEQFVNSRTHEPGFKDSCTIRPMSLLKIIRILDSRLKRASWRTPVELLPDGRLPYGEDHEDHDHNQEMTEKSPKAKSPNAGLPNFGTLAGDCGMPPEKNPNAKKEKTEGNQ
eukprot:TRINITY_DN33336_c0_g1_i1.p1 TRINITY_DN33336_c0_g1~~TRINITY_DN33336_c0_g1_i1.p1  ORF type:complete len:519 (+),score=116.87 TRINITY_DN33336_c0_g1_i1:49-1557(+)